MMKPFHRVVTPQWPPAPLYFKQDNNAGVEWPVQTKGQCTDGRWVLMRRGEDRGRP